MPVHPALDVRVDFVPDEEDYDRTDRLPESKGNCFERRIEFRVQQEEQLDRNRQDDGCGDCVEEESEEIGDDAGRLQAELERGKRGDADVGPSLRSGNGPERLKLVRGGPPGEPRLLVQKVIWHLTAGRAALL